MDENVRLAYLYDIYGELLSEHQKMIFEAARFDDLSFSEIAENFDITRQAGHDVYKRTVAKLEHYEQMLGQLGKYMEIRGMAERIKELAGGGAGKLDKIEETVQGGAGEPERSNETNQGESAEMRFFKIVSIADEIIEKL